MKRFFALSASLFLVLPLLFLFPQEAKAHPSCVVGSATTLQPRADAFVSSSWQESVPNSIYWQEVGDAVSGTYIFTSPSAFDPTPQVRFDPAPLTLPAATSIRSISLHALARRDAGAGTPNLVFIFRNKSIGHTIESAPRPVGAVVSWTDVSPLFGENVNPVTGLPWTEADINDLEIGVRVEFSGFSFNVYIAELIMEVCYAGGPVISSFTIGGAGAKSQDVVASPGTSTFVAWDTENTDACVGSGGSGETVAWNGPRALDGTFTFPSLNTPASHELKVTCTAAGFPNVEDTVSLRVHAPPTLAAEDTDAGRPLSSGDSVPANNLVELTATIPIDSGPNFDLRIVETLVPLGTFLNCPAGTSCQVDTTFSLSGSVRTFVARLVRVSDGSTFLESAPITLTWLDPLTIDYLCHSPSGGSCPPTDTNPNSSQKVDFVVRVSSIPGAGNFIDFVTLWIDTDNNGTWDDIVGVDMRASNVETVQHTMPLKGPYAPGRIITYRATAIARDGTCIDSDTPGCLANPLKSFTVITAHPVLTVSCSLDGAGNDFGNVLADGAGNVFLSQTCTLKNTGIATATGAISFTPILGPGDFSCTANCGYSIPGGSDVTATIVFDPVVSGPQEVQVDFTCPGCFGAQGDQRAMTGNGVDDNPKIDLMCHETNVNGIKNCPPSQAPDDTQALEFTIEASDDIGVASISVDIKNSSGVSVATASCPSSPCIFARGPFAVGSYTYTATVTDSAGQQIVLSNPFSVSAGPVANVAPSSLTFSAVAGGPDPPSQPVTISNTGGGSFDWTASDDRPWISLAPTSGTGVTPLSSHTLSVSVTNQPAGGYAGTITVTPSIGTPHTVSVTFNVSHPAPNITLNGCPGAPISVGDTVAFSATNSGGPITTWFWNFGDGVTSPNPSPVSHTYTAQGTYDVAVHVTGPGGADTASQTGCVNVVVPAVCGDGAANQPSEECDGGDFRGATCQSRGFTGGNLSCTGACTIDDSACFNIVAIPTGGLVPCGGCSARNAATGECVTPEPACGTCHIFQLIKNILDKFLFPIVPVLAGLLFALGGFFFLASFGNPQFLGRAKTIMVATVVGLLIVYSSWLLINLILQAMGVAAWTGLDAWWKITC